MIVRGLDDEDWKALAKLAYELHDRQWTKHFDTLPYEERKNWIEVAQAIFREGLAKLVIHLAEPD